MTPIFILEDTKVDLLYPLTYYRPPFLLRCGAGDLLDRMMFFIQRPIDGVVVRDTMAPRVRAAIKLRVNGPLRNKHGAIFVSGRWLMSKPFAEPPPDTAGLVGHDIAWMHLSPKNLAKLDMRNIVRTKTLTDMLPHVRVSAAAANLIEYPWDLITHNGPALRDDFYRRTPGIASAPMPGAHLLATENMCIDKDVTIYPGAVLDARNGPIMIESRCEIHPHTVITGPVFIGRQCIIRAGTCIRENTSIGPNCRLGGEITNSIFLGNSNKQHYGFLGQTVVGEWVNIGAGTTGSNLKNTYGEVRVPINGAEVASGLNFLGSVIGDHAKLGIGTYLSTGSVIGFSSHVLVTRPPKFVPSFSWLDEQGLKRIDFNKAVAIAQIAMERRDIALTAEEHELFVRIAEKWSTIEVRPQ